MRKLDYGLLTLLCVVLLAQSASAETDISGQANILADKLTSTKKGEVLNGSDTDVYINIGEKQGIVPGARFEIFRRGEPLKVDNQIVGYKESKVALVKVERIRDNVSNCSILEKKETPKSGDRAYELRAPVKRLVVAQFSYNQSYNQFTKNLQEKFYASFINKGMQVVERDQLEKVLAEQKLGYSGLINIESAKKIGELLGAEAMLLGSVSDLSDSISLSARLVDLGTGDSITAAETSMPKTPQIVDLLNNPVEERPYAVVPHPITIPITSKAGISRSSNIQQNDAYYENSFLKILPKAITISKDKKSISLALSFANLTEEVLYLAIDRGYDSSKPNTTIMSDKETFLTRSAARVTGLKILKLDDKYNDSRYFTSLDEKTNTTIIFSYLSDAKIEGTIFSFTAGLLRFVADEGIDSDGILRGKIGSFGVGIPNIVLE